MSDGDRAREVRGEVKAQWVELWMTKYEDEIRAEGLSLKDFEKLFVDRGEVIFATRDFKPLSFREILEMHLGSEDAAKVDLDPRVGGWGKFARQHFPPKPRRRERPKVRVDLSQQQRRGGLGWRNMMKIRRKIRENQQD